MREPEREGGKERERERKREREGGRERESNWNGRHRGNVFLHCRKQGRFPQEGQSVATVTFIPDSSKTSLLMNLILMQMSGFQA